MEWERFKKAFVAYAKEHVVPTSKELDLLYRVLTDTPATGPLLVGSSASKSPPPITLVRLALVTDRWGVLGSFLRLTRSGTSSSSSSALVGLYSSDAHPLVSPTQRRCPDWAVRWS
jgi:hypothetical protein